MSVKANKKKLDQTRQTVNKPKYVPDGYRYSMTVVLTSPYEMSVQATQMYSVPCDYITSICDVSFTNNPARRYDFQCPVALTELKNTLVDEECVTAIILHDRDNKAHSILREPNTPLGTAELCETTPTHVPKGISIADERGVWIHTENLERKR